ncbi:MAG TPA: DUF3022 domain-containing protein [Paraburkholderia sp.]|nr:DUF3022 domain-containing protein [Paraburkholderia sp.]
MIQAELEQRIEEIELALAGIFESPKAPGVSSYDEGTRLFIQLSWVVESHRDTSLDARCVVTIAFSKPQISRYAAMDTVQRKAFQERLSAWVRAQFGERQSPPELQGDCAVELDAHDGLFDVPQAPPSY